MPRVTIPADTGVVADRAGDAARRFSRSEIARTLLLFRRCDLNRGESRHTEDTLSGHSRVASSHQYSDKTQRLAMTTSHTNSAPETTLPEIIQGGMGAGVSGWQLARAVSSAGQLGVVSGAALDFILARRLQLGDVGGDSRRTLKAFPVARVAHDILERYFVEGGKPSSSAFKSKPMVGQRPSRATQQLHVAANFVEVFLAKEGHDGPVGINFLEKIQPPTLPSLYGAMLAGVDLVIVGAEIPKDIPGILDRLCDHEPVELDLHVGKAIAGKPHRLTFALLKSSPPAIPNSNAPTFFLSLPRRASRACWFDQRTDRSTEW